MDTNNPNPSTNLNPNLPQQPFNNTPASNPAAPVLPDLSSVWAPPPTNAPSAPLPDAFPPIPDSSSVLPAQPVSSASIPDLASTWSPPSAVNPMPQTPQPLAEPPLPQSAPASTLPVNNPVLDQAPQPVSSPVWPNFPLQQDQSHSSAQPTWIPPNPAAIQPEIPTNPNSDLNTSPLNNPWTTPLPTLLQNQPEPIAQPTWMPDNSNIGQQDPVSATSNNVQTLAGETLPSSENPGQPATQTDPAPTDLSHLISNNSLEIGGQTVTPTAPETLIVPSQTNNPVPNLPTSPKENHKGMPIWLIGIGISLLLIVAGASAYFILGVGQRQQSAVSIPAEVAKTTVKTPPPIAVPTPMPAATQSASESGSFGQFQNGQPPKASSAADIIKARQQQGK